MHLREQKIDTDNRQSGSDFARRHIGPNENETTEMLRSLGFENLDALIDATVPKNIRLDRELNLPETKRWPNYARSQRKTRSRNLFSVRATLIASHRP